MVTLSLGEGCTSESDALLAFAGTAAIGLVQEQGVHNVVETLLTQHLLQLRIGHRGKHFHKKRQIVHLALCVNNASGSNVAV
jgi:hypothetical protein